VFDGIGPGVRGIASSSWSVRVNRNLLSKDVGGIDGSFQFLIRECLESSEFQDSDFSCVADS